MNKTKQKIIDKSLALFNDNGFSNISQRTISDHLKISPGNLTYHFKKKDDILEYLYFEMVAELNKVFGEFEEHGKSVENTVRIFKILLNTRYKYRFVFLEFVNLTRTNPKIAKDYRALSKQRTEDMKKLFKGFESKDIISKGAAKAGFKEAFERASKVWEMYLPYTVLKEGKLTSKTYIKQLNAFFDELEPFFTKKGKTSLTECLG